MGFLPAVCAKCGLIFNSNLVGGGSGTIVGCSARCPSCGSMAPIPDGRYEIGKERTILRSLDSGQVQAIFGIAQVALQKNWSRKQVAEEISKTNKGLARFIPNDSQALAQWLMLLLLFISHIQKGADIPLRDTLVSHHNVEDASHTCDVNDDSDDIEGIETEE